MDEKGILDGALFTKEKRHELFGRVAGGSGSIHPERYQRSLIISNTGRDCPKTHMRINLRKRELVEIVRLPSPGRYDYTEDFDGVQVFDHKKVYVNLKCVAGKGGSQTRTLRNVYSFVEGQLNVLLNGEDVYFANVLDGDESSEAMVEFEYLLSLPEYASIQHRVYVGDLKNYIEWIRPAKKVIIEED